MLLADAEPPGSSCSFRFFGQIEPSNVPQYLLQELEDEMDTPTGINTIHPPQMKLRGVLVSKDCGILYELPEIQGLKYETMLYIFNDN